MNPTGVPGHNRGKRLPPEPLSPAEINRLLFACGSSPTGQRNAALVTAMYRGGLRVSEALALVPADLDLEAGWVTVRRGKGDKRRMVAIDPGACAILGAWLRRRTAMGVSKGAPLFCTIREGGQGGHRAIWPQQVRAMLARLALKAGIAGPVRPHGLRHAHAAELAREGIGVHAIQAQLGHANLAITGKYLRTIVPDESLRAVRERAWEGISPGA